MSAALSVSSAASSSSVVKKAWRPSAEEALKVASRASAAPGAPNRTLTETAKPARIVMIAPPPQWDRRSPAAPMPPRTDPSSARRPRSRPDKGLVVLDHAVDDRVLHGLLGRHEVVALGVLGDLVERLAGVLGDDLVEAATDVDDLLGVDL